MFKGTIRFNVDPTESCTDEEIRNILVEAELDQLILKKKEEDETKKKEREEKFKEHQERIAKAGRKELDTEK